MPLRLPVAIFLVSAAMDSRAAEAPVPAAHRVLVKFKEDRIPPLDSLHLPADSRLSDPLRPAPAAGAIRRRPGFKPIFFKILELPATADPAAVIVSLSARPDVEYAEPDGIGSAGEIPPNDPDATSQWHHGIIRTRTAWEITRGSSEVTLAVLDSGINASLPDFSDRLIAGYDFVNDDSDPNDESGHGSAVASVAAGTGNNGQDTAGIDWNCRIMPLKVLNADNLGYYSFWVSAIDYAVANGADVINLSAGGLTTSAALTNAIDSAISQGVIFVTITHNDGDAIRYPGNLPQCITVGATRKNDVRSSFSNYGPEIDLVAPGGVGSGGNLSTNLALTDVSGDLAGYYGTSFSAPQVAGTACLIRALRPTIEQAEMEAILCASALDLIGSATDTAGFDNYYGYGRLDVANALLLATAKPTLQHPAAGLVTLAWDSPANANTKKPFGIQYSTDLEHWITVDRSAPLVVSGGRATWTDDGSMTGSPPRDKRFYRSFIRR